MADKNYHVSREIQAPAATVWGLLSDADSWTEWNPTIVSLKGPIAVGQKVELVTTLNPKRTFKLGVDVMDEPKRMVWSDGMPLGLFTGTRTYTLDESGDTTTFSMTEEYTGLMSSLIVRSIPDMTDSFTGFADGLKEAAEAAAAG